MKYPNRKIVAFQFSVYTMGAAAAFISWILTIFDHTDLLYSIAGEYLTGHFIRWTRRLFLWGPIILTSGLTAAVAALLVLNGRATGGYLAVASFAIGFAVDVFVANVIFVHVLIGLLIGWVLLVPLLAGWDDLFENEEQQESI
jgi:O-antigen ligase